jgi:hypothetical protein
MKSPRIWRVILVLYVLVLGVISGLAYTKRLHVMALVGHLHVDKLLHFVLLGIASLLARGASADARMRLLRLPIGPFVVGVVATIDEFAQALSSARTFDLGDLAANLGGVIVFGWLAGVRPLSTILPNHLSSKGLS